MRPAAFLLALSLGTFGLVQAATVDDVTALEWLESSIGGRMEHVLAAMYVLEQHGVRFQKSPYDYHDALEDVIRRDPSLYGTGIRQILANYLYQHEPEAKKPLDELRV